MSCPYYRDSVSRRSVTGAIGENRAPSSPRDSRGPRPPFSHGGRPGIMALSRCSVGGLRELRDKIKEGLALALEEIGTR